MRNLCTFLIPGLLLLGCGDSTRAVSGTGAIREVSNIEFVGVALVDGATSELYDLSDVPTDEREVGNLVRYEGNVEPSNLAGIPQKIYFTRFQVIGVEN